MTKKVIKIAVTLMIILSSVSLYTTAEAAISYSDVRKKVQRSCHPLCNLTEYEINTNQMYFGPYNYPLLNGYYPQYQNYNLNLGYPQNYNLYGNAQGNPGTFGNVTQPPVYNQTNTIGNSAGYLASINTPPTYQGGIPAAYANNTPPAYTNNTPQTYEYNSNQPATYNNSALPKSGIESYFIFGIVTILTLGTVLYIRRKRKSMQYALSV